MLFGGQGRCRPGSRVLCEDCSGSRCAAACLGRGRGLRAEMTTVYPHLLSKPSPEAAILQPTPEFQRVTGVRQMLPEQVLSSGGLLSSKTYRCLLLCRLPRILSGTGSQPRLSRTVWRPGWVAVSENLGLSTGPASPP